MSRLQQICVQTDASLREAMAAIDAGGVEIALVIEDDGRLVGTLSDGDTRRALLGGATLDDSALPHVSRAFTSVDERADRIAVMDIMQARAISQVPVLDSAGRVVSLHVLRELIGGTERSNSAVIMAGGRGNRLRPLTETVPKPMVRVAGRPILERLVLHLVGSGIRTVYLAVNYMAASIEEHFGDGERFGCAIRYLTEDPTNPLGTAGALRLLPPDACGDGPLIVMNGDLIVQFDVGGLLEQHHAAGAVATVGVREYAHNLPFGVVDTDGVLVTSIHEKPTMSWAVNAGVYAIEPSLLDDIPGGCEFPMTELLASCLQRGATVASFEIIGEWIDVGRVDELRRARGEA